MKGKHTIQGDPEVFYSHIVCDIGLEFRLDMQYTTLHIQELYMIMFKLWFSLCLYDYNIDQLYCR